MRPSDPFNELALFAGIGGGILGGQLLGWRTVCAVEKEPFCREVLLRRQRDGLLSLFPIWDDIKTFDGKPWHRIVDIVTAGFPCQPWSFAGPRKGMDDDRNLWPDTIRVLREVGPRFAFLENVPGLVSTDYFGQILGDLAEAGFDAVWDIVSAAEIGAPHRRERLWILAHANGQGKHAGAINAEMASASKSVPDAICNKLRHESRRVGRSRWQDPAESRDDGEECTAAIGNSWWHSEPDVGRVVDGVPHRMDRLRALGNAQVPGVAAVAYLQLRNALDYMSSEGF